MKAHPTPIAGATIMEWPVHVDERGSFHRIADRAQQDASELPLRACQWSLSRNNKKGTFRGIHFQWPPYEETKLVSCVSGKIFDVLVDLRPASETRECAACLELCAGDGRTLYVPPGVAHGFLCLEDDTALLYGITPEYKPDSTFGVRWNDPAVNIDWPISPTIVADRDQSWPDLSDILARMSDFKR